MKEGNISSLKQTLRKEIEQARKTAFNKAQELKYHEYVEKFGDTEYGVAYGKLLEAQKLCETHPSPENNERLEAATVIIEEYLLNLLNSPIE